METAAAAGASARPDEDAATSPDLLKNTPSNIARLEDVIEQCEGREKYRARTASPSDGEDVRWYFCKVPLAPKGLSASVPRTEIVGKSDYFRFSVRDSLALEASFLQREEDLLAHWWKEYAECSEGPRGFNMTSKISSSNDDSDQFYAVDEERLGVPVKGGLYEVDLVKRHCFPVYWNGENRRVLRGHWFARKGNLDWLPLREDIAEQLELAYHCQVWHRRTFQPSGLFAARVDLQGANKDLHALFTGEDATWEAFLIINKSGFSLGTGKGNTFKLRRGFSSSGCQRPTQDELRQQKEEEMDDYCSQVPVGHLVFMVHGIGQRLEKSNLVDDVGNFRHITASLAERHLSPYQRSIQRVLYIPCQWRRGLKLSGEHDVEQITLDGVRGLRVTLSATVHDVLYYMSPIYCQDIIDSVSNQLNKLYKKFLKRNPGYNGKISIYGHSLGSVLSYDILCHQENLSSPFPMHSVYMESEREKGKQMDNRLEEPNNNDTSDVHSENTSVQLAEESAALDKEKSKTSDVAYTYVPTVAVSSNPAKLEDVSVRDHKIDSPVEGAEITLDCQLFTDLTSSKECSKHDVEPEAIASEQMDPNFGVMNEFQDNNAGSLKDTIELGCRDKDELIIMLKEEVKSLKAKLAELIQNDDGKKEDEGTKIHSSGNQSEEQVYPTKSYTPYIKYTKLDFEVDTFFAVGSPLGVFLALRNIRIGIGKGQDYWEDGRISEEMPSCRQMFNIFHPFDPVAYRIEPMVCKEYLSKRPVIIPYHRGGKRLHIGIQEFTEDVAARSQAFVNHLNSVKVKVVSVFYPRNKDTLEDATSGSQHKERSYGAIMMKRLTGSESGRVDHVLQDKTFEHPYISALGAHTNYWRDFDTALFILKHLYRDIPEELDVAKQDCEGSVENKRKQIELFFQNEAMEEDIPLTFSDKPMVREFARKARMATSSS